MTAFRAKRLAKGLCSRCGKNPTRPGLKTCGCDLIYLKARNEKLVQAKVCRRCGDRLRAGFQLCAKCRKYDTEQKRKRLESRFKKGFCKSCGIRPRLPNQNWCQTCCDSARRYASKVRLEVFNAYGGATCVCCGESEPDFLTIDHINGGGTAHRKAIGVGRSIYPWLRARGFPKGYRVLCFNCNCGRKSNGVCPHKRKRTT